MTKKSPVSSLQKQLMTRHYNNAFHAKQEGRPVVYVTAMFPVEIVRAFEPHVAIVYPENHAVNIIVSGMAEELSSLAITREHLDTMGCSYELANTGYLLAMHGLQESGASEAMKKLPPLPAPDILLACNNQCDVVAEWYQNLSALCGNIPYRVINVGNRYDGVVDPSRVQYVREQLLDVISLLEEKTLTHLDRDLLLEIAGRANQAAGLWKRYLDFGKRIPSPITAFDGFFHMALIVSERGTKSAIDYYEKLLKETLDRVDSGEAAVSPERHRVLWDNLATWFNFGELKRTLAGRGTAVVGSTYLDVWKKEFDTSSFDTLLTSMAEAYCVMYTNLTLQERIALWKQMVRDYRAEGVLFHNNRSCHTFSRLQGQIAEALKKEFGEGFKAIVFDGDMGLEERFQKHRFFTAIETFF
ncbi:MAG: 2-hydroxyacyl-CoA dehydratase family protein [Desulfomonilia bacterium]|jgi:benzoyl-CoA reductase/2-hydroxyglutaryl-CoA dehydratase subunit BcrC/BadD/HgdB